MRGSGSCTHLQAGAAGRLQTVWQDSCGVWSGHMYWGVKRGGGSGGRGFFPLFHPCHTVRLCWKALFMLVIYVCLKVCAWLIQGFQSYLWITSGHADRRLWIPLVHRSNYPIMLKGIAVYISVWSHNRACSFLISSVSCSFTRHLMHIDSNSQSFLHVRCQIWKSLRVKIEWIAYLLGRTVNRN